MNARVQSLCLASLLVGCSSLGIEVDGENVPVIDAHLHTGYWDDIPEIQQESIIEFLPGVFSNFPGATADAILSARGIRDNMNNANVNWGVLFAVYAPESTGVATNELVYERRQKYPDRLLTFGSVLTDDWELGREEQLANLERALRDLNMIGVKLAPTHQKFRMDDPAYYLIYELAGRYGAPVYLHIGNSKAPGSDPSDALTNPEFLEEAIQLFPETTFILGHMGFDFRGSDFGDVDTCIHLAQKYENVYLEASALGTSTNDPDGGKLREVYARIKASGVVDRVIYGSDGPIRPGFLKSYLNLTRAALEANDYTLQEYHWVFHENFERVTAQGLERHGIDITVNYAERKGGVRNPFGR